MKKRIVKREYPDGKVLYVKQTRNMFFIWSDVVISTVGGVYRDTYDTLEEARKANQEPTDTVIEEWD